MRTVYQLWSQADRFGHYELITDKSIGRTATIEESDLIAGLKARKTNALEYLYDRYSPALFGVVARVIPERDVAEEALPDVLVRIVDRIY